MSRRSGSRRRFLAGSAGAIASAALSRDASAQSGPVINDPSVVQEVEAAFAAYYRALAKNDVAALNDFFFDSPVTIRYGNAEILYGHSEIKAYRAAVSTPAEPKLERTVITTFGKDFATASTLNRRSSDKVGRTMQTWVRFPRGWRIVAAHVSTIDEQKR
jgi:ketosteroid isomerase-like protein